MKHTLMKLGAGVGLMAASASAFAGTINGGADQSLHSFGSPMIYAKTSGSPVVLAAFIPSGNQSTDNVILLELTQGTGTALGTWQYFMNSDNLSGIRTSPGMKYAVTVNGSSSGISGWAMRETISSYSDGMQAVLNGAINGQSSFTWWGPIGNGTTAGWQGAPETSNGEIEHPFSMSSVVSASSATCNVTFNAYVGTDDYLNYWIAGINVSNALDGAGSVFSSGGSLSTASASYTITTKSGGAAHDTLSGTYPGSTARALASYNTNATNSVFVQIFFPSGTGAWYNGGVGRGDYAITYASVSVAGKGGGWTGSFSLGSESLKQIAACASIANARLALNSSWLKYGLLRLW